MTYIAGIAFVAYVVWMVYEIKHAPNYDENENKLKSERND